MTPEDALHRHACAERGLINQAQLPHRLNVLLISYYSGPPGRDRYDYSGYQLPQSDRQRRVAARY